MNKYILTTIALFILVNTKAQTFYNLVVKDYPLENKTFLMDANNCDSQKIYTCPPTNNLSEFYENVYWDIAIDTNQNMYYVSPRGSLYMRNLKDTTSCQFLGTFGLNGNNINALEVDFDGNLYAAGNLGSSSDGSALYKYTASTHVFSTVGKFPINILSGGDLFFYEGNLFLTAYDSYDNDSTSFLVKVNVSDPSLSCHYMDLPVAFPWGAFSVKYGSYSKAYIIVPGIFANDYISTLYEVDMLFKKISQPLCIYSQAILGSASIYSFIPSFLNNNTCSLLPITLTKFNYTINNKKVKLMWETATEINSNYCLIERSLNGNDFSMIGQKACAINSNTPKQYSFIDNNPSHTNYYRLKQVDIDGKFTYSNVLVVKVVQINPFKIVQNPVRDILQIQVNLEKAKINLLTVFDFSGRKLKSFKGQSGLQNIDVSFIAAGTYLLQLLTRDGSIYNEPFIKIY